MKRGITLYIGGRLADIDAKTLIQMTYTAEELTNPTIVKNSYSKKVTLKGTPRNNALMGAFFRLDRKTKGGGTLVGEQLNPLKKVPFVIYNERSEVVERGYIKLEEVKRKKNTVEYSITLFGGIGEFFYELSYRDDGEKKTLADLDYLGKTDPERELDFRITAASVGEAWASIGSGKWGVINFAPAYNGLPENFDAAKALIQPSTAGLAESVTEEEVTYDTAYHKGWSLVDMPRDYTEWQVKDLRSYLQRPVVSIKAIVSACCKPGNNGGHTVNLDPTFFNSNNPYYERAWVTLKMITAIERDAESGQSAITWNEDVHTLEDDGYSSTVQAVYSADLSESTSKVQISVKPRPVIDLEYLDDEYLMTFWDDTYEGYVRNHIIIYAVAYLANEGIISKKIAFGADELSMDGIDETKIGSFKKTGEGVLEWGGESATLTFEDVAGIESISLHAYVHSNVSDLYQTYAHYLRGSAGIYLRIRGYAMQNNAQDSYVEFEGYESPRSNALITKAQLLGGEKTPADYLISYAKVFGLHFLYDKASKAISIVTRNTLYDGSVIDLSERIDYAKDVKIQPYSCDAKWYDFGFEYEEGKFAEEYAEVKGGVYGRKRINTGYDFNSESKSILDDVAYSGAVEVLEHGKFFLNIQRAATTATYLIPPPCLDAGLKYSLYSDSGDAHELDFPTAVSTDTITYHDEVYKGYDAIPKVQLYSGDNEGIDGDGVLLFYRGTSTKSDYYKQFALTDDVGAMSTANGGTPCWILNAAKSFTPLTRMPMFGRYLYEGSEIIHSLDLGTPEMIDIPDIRHGDMANIFTKGWEAYLVDRYDVDTKIVTCKVDMRGIVVDERLLRKFYYFEGCYWVLNKIKDYNLADDVPMVECEFVKVKDKKNYTGGQSWQ